MGIPICRFIGDKHEPFVCAICLDVAANPVVTNDCDHIFCNSCLEEADSLRCPSCREELKDPKWSPIKGSIKRIYMNLQLKCLIDSCACVLDVDSYKSHDEACGVICKPCKDCGYSIKQGTEGNHACVKVLQQTIQDMQERIKRLEEVSTRNADLHRMEIARRVAEKWIKSKEFDDFIKESKHMEEYNLNLVLSLYDINGITGPRRKWIETIVEFFKK